MDRPKKPKLRHHLRHVIDAVTIDGIQRNAWGDPIGAQDIGGGWYAEPRLGRFKT